MDAPVTTIATWKTKAIVYGIMIAVFLAMCGLLKHYYDENVRQNDQIEELEEQNEKLNKQNILLEKSNKISDAAKQATDQKIEANAQTDLRDKNKVEQQVRTLKKQFISAGKTTPADVEALNQQVSIIRIQGLWTTYCTDHVDNDECQQLAQEQNREKAS